jgi:hypothetical protein
MYFAKWNISVHNQMVAHMDANQINTKFWVHGEYYFSTNPAFNEADKVLLSDLSEHVDFIHQNSQVQVPQELVTDPIEE